MTPAKMDWTTPVWRLSLALGALGALAAWAWGRADLALGWGLGSAGSVAHFAALHRLTKRLTAGAGRGPGSFWFLHLARWALFLLAAWLFWRVSPACFLGAALAYLTCLALLLAAAFRAPKPGKSS
ncbi:MAG TPA: hypothetical protein VFR02_07450 [bacterium]|nr:hypothetical protein [bacterium]